MTDGLKELFSTAHGVMMLLLIIAATILCAIKIMPLDEWKSFAQIIFATFAGTHAIVTGAQHIAASRLPRAQTEPKKEKE